MNNELNLGTLYVLTRGGFGNVLFNYLVGYSLSKQHKMKLVFINSNEKHRPNMQSYKIFKNCQFQNTLPQHCIKLYERSFVYNPITIPDVSRPYLLDGYFQSYKYSYEYLQEIRQKLLDNVKDSFHEIIRLHESISDGKKTIMLHVRRGDYLKLQDIHSPLSDSYYEKALDILVKNRDAYKIMAFSDDNVFLHNWNLLQEYDYHIVELTDIIETFLLMSLCDDFIISNSTFSLLAYYFRKNVDSKLCIPVWTFWSKI